jgi:hypothetical protein
MEEETRAREVKIECGWVQVPRLANAAQFGRARACLQLTVCVH